MQISVLIPCYQAAAYLGEALQSVFAQSRPPDEIIVVDDGSTDDTASVAREAGRGVRYQRQEHAGIAAARNRAVRLASHELVAFLDADDVWPPSSVADRLAVLETDPGLGGASGLVEQFISPELPDEVRRTLTFVPGASPARVAGAMLLRRALFDQVGLFQARFRVGETIDWVARADAAGVRLGT
ncbi:MAG: glycosyltransferase family 2 protein, partial [Gemmatimonadaceae bacterium]|nr:glycosyltransferase family 2 protein [Gemmatimonadaceae bacterium]